MSEGQKAICKIVEGMDEMLCELGEIREHIVWCRDCKHFVPDDGCHLFDNAFVGADGFCAWGERKDEG